MSAVGVPRCSCKRIISEREADLALATRSVRIVFPRFNRIEVGKSSRTSFAKALRRDEGDREVVTKGRGSMRPDVKAYSSSRSTRSAVSLEF